VVLEGKIKIGKNCYIAPNVVLRNTTLADHVTIEAHSMIDGAVIQSHCQVDHSRGYVQYRFRGERAHLAISLR